MADIAKRVVAEHALLVDSPLPSLLDNSDAAGTSVPFTAASGVTVTRVASTDRGAESLEPSFAVDYTSSAALFAGITFTIPNPGVVGRGYPGVEVFLADSLAGQGARLHMRSTYEFLSSSGAVLGTFRTYTKAESDAGTAPSGAEIDLSQGDGSPAAGDMPFKFLRLRQDGKGLNTGRPSGTASVRITLSFYDVPNPTSVGSRQPAALARTIYVTRLRAVLQDSTGTGGTFPVGMLSGNYQEIGGSAITYRYVRGGDVAGVVDEIDSGAMTLTVFDALVGVADPRLRPGRRVTLAARNAAAGNLAQEYGSRSRALWAKVWTGVVTDVQASFEGYKGTEHPKRPRITITATDAKTAAEGIPAPYGFVGPELWRKASRIRRGNTGALSVDLVTDPDGGDTDFGGAASSNVNVVLPSASLWQQLELARNSYPNAKLWVGASGYVALKTVAPPASPTYTLTDGSVSPSGSVPYVDLELAYGSRILVNSLTVKRTNASETDGEKVYGPYVAPRSVSEWGTVSSELETTDGDPTTLARNFLAIYATPKTFPRTVTFSGFHAAAQAAQLPWADLYSSVRIINAAAGVDVAAWVVGIRAEVTKERWLITWTLRPMEPPAIAATNQSGVGKGPTDVVAVNTGTASELAGSVDLNTMSTPGQRAQSDNTEAASGLNYPVPQAGLLEVETNAAGTMVWQRYTVYAGTTSDAGTVWVRTFYSGAWTAWQKLQTGTPTPPTAATVPFSPSGSITSTNVQAAIAELDGDMTVPQPYASRYKSTDQSVATGTWTNIPVESELFPTRGGVTYSAPSLTVPKAGRYLVRGSVRWAGNSTGSRGCGLARNGTSMARTSVGPSGTENTTVICARIAYLAANDTITLQGYQASGGALVARLAENSTALELTWLGP